ncbi:MAG: FMN-binding protein [Gemmatimonadetes bacterium]|nr:FMN-binding protein [Gemmatimonadota bacterium]
MRTATFLAKRCTTVRSLLPLIGLVCTPMDVSGQVLLTQEEALQLAFPEPAGVERRTAFLAEDELAEVKRLAEPAESNGRSVVTYYIGRNGDQPLGVAYFDAHRVRTLQEVLMIVVDRRGRVARIEVLGFAEPPEYMAPDGWLELFSGRGLDHGTSTRGDIPIITGATLTARAATGAVRRSLALHQVIGPFDGFASADSERGQ